MGRGERFPFCAPEAEGFIVGQPADQAAHFAACMEGVAYLERLSYQTLADLGAEVSDAISSAGGGARSDAWLQIRADVLGKTVVRPHAADAAVGAAIVAASMEHFDNLTDAAQAMVSIDRTLEPRPEMQQRYSDAYSAFMRELERRGYLTPEWPG
jgi:sugar (pentulose or hexulose) kinase